MGKKNKRNVKSKIPQTKKPKVENIRDSELIDALKEIAIDWIEKPHTTTKSLFALIWLYYLVRVFITDLDLNIFTTLFLIDNRTYIFGRTLLVSSILLLYWHFAGNNKALKNLILLILYPVYPVLFKIIKCFTWSIPKYLFKKKDSYIVYIYIDTIISYIVNIKVRLAKLLLFLIGVFLLYSTNSIWLYISILSFGIIQLGHLYKRYHETFSPLKVFQMNVAQFKPKSQFSRSKFDENIDKVVNSNAKETNKKIARMEYFLMVGEFSRVLQSKISSVLNSRSYFKSFFFKGIYSLLLAMLLFGFINQALFKIDTSHFQFKGSPKYFEFFYYSFFTIFPDGSDIEPITRTAKVIRMFGVGVGVIINLLILVVLITVKSERYRENLQSLNEWAYSHSTEVALYFEEKFGQRTAEGLNFLIESGSETAIYLEKIKNLIK